MTGRRPGIPTATTTSEGRSPVINVRSRIYGVAIYIHTAIYTYEGFQAHRASAASDPVIVRSTIIPTYIYICTRSQIVTSLIKARTGASHQYIYFYTRQQNLLPRRSNLTGSYAPCIFCTRGNKICSLVRVIYILLRGNKFCCLVNGIV